MSIVSCCRLFECLVQYKSCRFKFWNYRFVWLAESQMPYSDNVFLWMKTMTRDGVLSYMFVSWKHSCKARFSHKLCYFIFNLLRKGLLKKLLDEKLLTGMIINVLNSHIFMIILFKKNSSCDLSWAHFLFTLIN